MPRHVLQDKLLNTCWDILPIRSSINVATSFFAAQFADNQVVTAVA